jgi:hypothetical protein
MSTKKTTEKKPAAAKKPAVKKEEKPKTWFDLYREKINKEIK